MGETIQWLLESQPWVVYNTKISLLNQKKDSQETLLLKKEIIKDAKIHSILSQVSQWPGLPLKKHNDASHLLHKLVFLADIGLDSKEIVIQSIIQKIFDQQAKDGCFQILANIHPRFGGKGVDELGWMLCDSPLILYSLSKFGCGEDLRVTQAARYLSELIRENGWPCKVSENFGKFRGPGRKEDPCPYATLVSLKALSQIPSMRDSEACHIGAETILDLWGQRRERRPYLFAMGSSFKKLKAPLIWYDILHVEDTLTNFTWLGNDKRLHEIINEIKRKTNEDGTYQPESIWTAWREWDFGQKKTPSPWMTFLVLNVLRKFEKIQQ
ncbi:hypothetical protein EU534_01515 [Candidatus Heimdallarchaeota archaeon]|nr:MAG: hypothetical protein EU534_01515 [Candidatus Heimdallarchaeota archaeon]